MACREERTDMTYDELKETGIFLWKIPGPTGTLIEKIEMYHATDGHLYMVHVFEDHVTPRVFKQIVNK